MAEDPSSGLTCDLPGDVMLEILSRIPVKSSVRFKCVSQAWYSLVKNPFFIEKHYAYPHEIEGDGFLVVGQDTASNIGIIRPGLNKWEAMGIGSPYKLEFIGRSKRLICMTPLDKFKHGSVFLVMNPAIREYIITYKELVCAGKSEKYELISVQFRYDSENNDFKIVRIEQVKEESGVRCSEVNVYSLNTNSWKKIKSGVNIKLSSRIGMQSCNLLCWRSNPCRELTAFGLTSEKFYTIPLLGRCLRIESKQNSLGAGISERDYYSAGEDSKFWKCYAPICEKSMYM